MIDPDRRFWAEPDDMELIDEGDEALDEGDVELEDFNPNHDPRSGRFTSAEAMQARQEAHQRRSEAAKAAHAHRKRSAAARAAHEARKARLAEPFELPHGASAHQTGVTAVSRVLNRGMNGAPATKGEVQKASKQDVEKAVEAFAATRHLKEPKLPEGTDPEKVKTAYRLGVTIRRFVRDPESRKVIASAITTNSISWAKKLGAALPEHALAVAHKALIDKLVDGVNEFVTDSILGGIVVASTAAGGPVGGVAATMGGAVLHGEIEHALDRFDQKIGFTPEHIKEVLHGIGHDLLAHYQKWKAVFGVTSGHGRHRVAHADSDPEPDIIEQVLAALDEAVESWEPIGEDEDEA